MLHSVYDPPTAAEVYAQFDRILDYITGKLPAVAERLETADVDTLAFAEFADDVWSQARSNNPNERLKHEIRHPDSVGIFPNR